VGRDSINSIDANFERLSSHITSGIIVDIGTGDGRFVYQSARKNPDRFYIGIEAAVDALQKTSEKICRKPEKGGAKNALFIQATAENLPEDLNDIADEVHIHFPWGSLLGAVALGDQLVLKNIRRICRADALLEVLIGVDFQRDATEVERLHLLPFTESFVNEKLRNSYRDAGFDVTECGTISAEQWPCIDTTWAHRLQDNKRRELFYLIARAQAG
jgi:16S rRNA (adenine(1408)-N(1))-methyltransferase